MALAVARLRLAALASLRLHPRGALVGWLPWILASVVGLGAVALAAADAFGSVVATAAVLLAAAAIGLVGDRDAALDPRAFRGLAPWWQVAVGTALGAVTSPLAVLAVGVGAACAIDAGQPSGMLAIPLLVATAALVRLVADPGGARDARPWIGGLLLVLLAGIVLAPLLAGWESGLGVLASSPVAASTTWMLGDVGRLGIALATIAALAALWAGIVARRMATVPRPRRREHLGLLRATPAVPWMVVAARTVTMWMRDRRYHAIAVAVVALPVLLALPVWLVGMPRELWTLAPVGVLALFAGWALHDDTAYDGSAWWMHLAPRVPGWQDRLGRLLPAAVAGGALVAIAAIVGVRLHGDERLLVPVLGAAFALLGAGLGVSAVVGARWPYPVSGPDASVFEAPAAQTWSAALTQAGALVAAAALAAPVVVPVVRDIGAPDAMWGPIGAGVGALVAVLGIAIGGRVLDVRGPEVLASAMRD